MILFSFANICITIFPSKVTFIGTGGSTKLFEGDKIKPSTYTYIQSRSAGLWARRKQPQNLIDLKP